MSSENQMDCQFIDEREKEKFYRYTECERFTLEQTLICEEISDKEKIINCIQDWVYFTIKTQSRDKVNYLKDEIFIETHREGWLYAMKVTAKIYFIGPNKKIASEESGRDTK